MQQDVTITTSRESENTETNANLQTKIYERVGVAVDCV
jgi:hypothetical protein